MTIISILIILNILYITITKIQKLNKKYYVHINIIVFYMYRLSINIAHFSYINVKILKLSLSLLSSLMRGTKVNLFFVFTKSLLYYFI